MSLTEISMHEATGITIARHYPANCNLIKLRIERGDRIIDGLEISVFGLPEHVTDALIAALGAPEHTFTTPVRELMDAAE